MHAKAKFNWLFNLDHDITFCIHWLCPPCELYVAEMELSRRDHSRIHIRAAQQIRVVASCVSVFPRHLRNSLIKKRMFLTDYWQIVELVTMVMRPSPQVWSTC